MFSSQRKVDLLKFLKNRIFYFFPKTYLFKDPVGEFGVALLKLHPALHPNHALAILGTLQGVFFKFIFSKICLTIFPY